VGIRCADHAAPSIRKKLALTSPTYAGISVGIVNLRPKTKEFVLFVQNDTSDTTIMAPIILKRNLATLH
jgi:hypothetical protein